MPTLNTIKAREGKIYKYFFVLPNCVLPATKIFQLRIIFFFFIYQETAKICVCRCGCLNKFFIDHG